MKNKKKILEIGIICVFFLVMAGYVEATEHNITDGNQVIRASPGGRSTYLDLKLDAENLLKDYDYKLVIPATAVTREEADQCFVKACREIEESFYAPGDSADHVSHGVTMGSSFVDGMVSAEWTLSSYQFVDNNGEIRQENLKENALVQANVLLTCGRYEQEFSFTFQVVPLELSKGEQLLADIEDAIEMEKDKEGEKFFQLPQEIDGISLQWSEPKQHLFVKVLFFEIIIIILLFMVAQERKRTKLKERQEQMSLDYAEFVNKLLILLGSGMSLKQSMNRISARYLDKRQKKQLPERYLYEELLITNYEIQDGESERRAYQKFGERTGLSCYHRLVRILIQNLQTGNRGLCEVLSQEAQVAFEERKALARKLGEEAGTKMLLPLVLMLGIVIAIIMVPAMQSFSV